MRLRVRGIRRRAPSRAQWRRHPFERRPDCPDVEIPELPPRRTKAGRDKIRLEVEQCEGKSPSERIAMLDSISELGIRLAVIGERMRHPEMSEEEARRAVFFGRDARRGAQATREPA